MSFATQEVINLMEILPEKEQIFALEIIKKLVRAWDPDFTKATSSECSIMDEAMRDFENGDTISHNEINWD